jgi:pimeloyl-ACP methyl ester carboxylesterase
VLVDQRGTGGSQPLACSPAGSDENLQGYLDPLLPPEQVRACRRAHEGSADLTRYTTSDYVDDLDEVRAALEYERINVWGGSYGTRVALAYIRRHPGRVRSAVLEGVTHTFWRYPLHHAAAGQRALGLLFEACRADPRCVSAAGDPSASLDGVLARFEDGAISQRVTLPDGRVEALRLHRDVFLDWLRTRMYSAATAVELPLLLRRAATDGDLGWLLQEVIDGQRALREGDNWFSGLWLSVTCAEDVPLITERAVERATRDTIFGDYRVRRHQQACREWPQGVVPAGFEEFVRADVPVLVISGELDPVTPPSAGRDILVDLTGARHVVARQGHIATDLACMAGVIEQFIRLGEATSVDASCLEAVELPPWPQPAASDAQPAAAPEVKPAPAAEEEAAAAPEAEATAAVQAEPTTSPQSAATTPARGRLVDIGGARLLLDCAGSGSPTIVIDGGAGLWSIHYRHIQDALAHDSRVCTFDPAGLGRSDAVPGPRTSSQAVTELHRLLRAAGIEPPYLLAGHSYGGYNALIYQRRYANEVAGLVLFESGHREQWERLPPEVWGGIEAALPSMFAVADGVASGEITPEQLPPWPEGLPAAYRAEYEVALRRPELHETIAEMFAGARKSGHQVPDGDLGDAPLVVLSAGRSFDAFAGTGMPIEPSNAIWAELQRELAALSTRSTHRIVATATHNIHITDPDAVVEAIRLGLQQARECMAPEPSLSTIGIHRLPERSTPEVDAMLEEMEGAYRSMDVEAFLSSFSDDIQQLDINRRVLVRGKDAWRELTVRVNGAHRWMERIHHGRLLAGDRLIVEIEWAGRVRGDALPQVGEDRDYRYTGLGILELDGGKVRRQTLYADFATLSEQLDAASPPLRCALQQ